MKTMLSLLLVFFWVSAATADPSPYVRSLQKEPLTLFDWGVFNARKHMNSVADRINKSLSFYDGKMFSASGGTFYDTKKNIISLQIIIQHREVFSNIEYTCNSIIKDLLPVIPPAMLNWFSHAGEEIKLKYFSDQLISMMEMQIIFINYGNNDIWFCTKPLVGGEISITKKE